MKFKSLPVVFLLVLSSCGGQMAGTGQISGSGRASVDASGGFDARCRRDFGTNDAARRLEAFIAAADRFSSAATEIQGTLLGACRKMGRALVMTDAELSAGGDDAVRVVCQNVSRRLQAEMQALRAQAGITIAVRSQPPRCTVDVDAAARCTAECDVRVQPGVVDVECTGGELRGGCSAQCTGTCAVDVEASCSGTCEGMCDGQCSATDRDGTCRGTCSGTCRGQCVTQVSGGCTGECRGGCSVAFTRPRCTGVVKPPKASADCQAACDARLKAEVDCEPGRMDVAISGNLGPDVQARAERLARAIREGMGEVLTVRERVQRLRESGTAVVRLADGLRRDVASFGLNAVGCVGSSLSALQRAMGSVTVTVQVSVEVSGSVSAR